MRARVAFVFVVCACAGWAQRSSHGVTIGGSGNQTINAAVVDAAGNIYVTGTTTSFDFPLRNAMQTANSGTELIYSSDAGATWQPLGNPVAAAPLSPMIVALDPTNAQTVYAAAGMTVCRSTDGGHTSPCVTIGMGTFQTTLTGLVVDPRSSSTLYASATTNGGVFKSTDAGQTWKNASAGLPSNGFIASLTIDPFRSSVLYAWAGNGGYFSTDGASTWTRVNLSWPAGASVSGLGFPSFTFDPVTPGVIYAPTFTEGTNKFGAQKSTDGGLTWTDLNVPFNGCCVVPDPKVSGTLYALIEVNGPPVVFWKSTDAGATWTSVNLPTGASNELAVDPANSSIIMAGGFRSVDGGSSWQPTNASRAITPAFSAATPGVVYAAAPITSEAFLAKYLPDGRTLEVSTYFGGMGNDTGQGIALDSSGNIWVTGTTSSYDLPVTTGAFQTKLNGNSNAFVAKFTGGGKLLAATYAGGSGTDSGLGSRSPRRGVHG